MVPTSASWRWNVLEILPISSETSLWRWKMADMCNVNNHPWKFKHTWIDLGRTRWVFQQYWNARFTYLLIDGVVLDFTEEGGLFVFLSSPAGHVLDNASIFVTLLVFLWTSESSFLLMWAKRLCQIEESYARIVDIRAILFITHGAANTCRTEGWSRDPNPITFPLSTWWNTKSRHRRCDSMPWSASFPVENGLNTSYGMHRTRVKCMIAF